MTSAVRGRGGVRRAMVLLLTTLTVLFGTNISPAGATTPDNATTYVNLTLSESVDPQNNRGRYNAAITQLRLAAGREIRDNVWLTSGTAQSAGLIELRIWGDNGVHLLTVYINPQNLYVGGFRSISGESYLLNDASVNIRNEVAREHGPAIIMPLAGTYGSLIGAASNQGLEEPSALSVYALTGSLRRLANLRYDQIHSPAHRANIAVDMLRLIGMFAEAARFPLYRDSFGNGLGTQTTTVLTTLHRELRTEWGAISEWARHYLRDNNTAPRPVQGVDTFRDWSDIVQWLRAINGRPEGKSV